MRGIEVYAWCFFLPISWKSFALVSFKTCRKRASWWLSKESQWKIWKTVAQKLFFSPIRRTDVFEVWNHRHYPIHIWSPDTPTWGCSVPKLGIGNGQSQKLGMVNIETEHCEFLNLILRIGKVYQNNPFGHIQLCHNLAKVLNNYLNYIIARRASCPFELSASSLSIDRRSLARYCPSERSSSAKSSLLKVKDDVSLVLWYCFPYPKATVSRSSFFAKLRWEIAVWMSAISLNITYAIWMMRSSVYPPERRLKMEERNWVGHHSLSPKCPWKRSYPK